MQATYLADQGTNIISKVHNTLLIWFRKNLKYGRRSGEAAKWSTYWGVWSGSQELRLLITITGLHYFFGYVFFFFFFFFLRKEGNRLSEELNVKLCVQFFLNTTLNYTLQAKLKSVSVCVVTPAKGSAKSQRLSNPLHYTLIYVFYSTIKNLCILQRPAAYQEGCHAKHDYSTYIKVSTSIVV